MLPPSRSLIALYLRHGFVSPLNHAVVAAVIVTFYRQVSSLKASPPKTVNQLLLAKPDFSFALPARGSGGKFSLAFVFRIFVVPHS